MLCLDFLFCLPFAEEICDDISVREDARFKRQFVF